jgi:hypothetical protein
MAAEYPRDDTVKIRRVKSRVGEGSEWSTPETAPEKTTKIVGVETSSTRSRVARANTPPQPLRPPIPRRGRASDGSKFEKMLERAAKIEGRGAYGAASRNVRGNYPLSLGPPTAKRDPAPDSGLSVTSRPPQTVNQQAPTTPVKRGARVQQVPYRLASPKGFMENAQKVWRAPNGKGNADVVTAQTSGSGTATTVANSGRTDIGKTLPHQVEGPVEELISLAIEDKEGGQDTHVFCDGDDYAALCFLYPHVNSDIILLYLNGCDGKVEDAKARLGKLDSLNLINSVDETGGELDLLDISNVDLRATAPTTRAQSSSLDLMDLIDLGADSPQAESSHLLDDELSSSFSTLSLAPTLASRSGNIPYGNTGGKAAPIENKHSSYGGRASPASSGALLPPLQPLTYSKWVSVPHIPVPPKAISQNIKIPVINHASPASVQGQGQSTRATIGASNDSKATGNSSQGLNLTRSIWADAVEHDSMSKSHQRRRDY